jgi:hypothetical protein
MHNNKSASGEVMRYFSVYQLNQNLMKDEYSAAINEKWKPA